MSLLRRYWALLLSPWLFALALPALVYRRGGEASEGSLFSHALTLFDLQPMAYVPGAVCALVLTILLGRWAAGQRFSGRALIFFLFCGCVGAAMILVPGMAALWRLEGDPTAATWLFMTVIALICMALALWAARAVVNIMWLDEQ